jgi:hypothetical protein
MATVRDSIGFLIEFVTPGLVPGSTVPQENSVEPFSSLQGGPRNQSGVTG